MKIPGLWQGLLAKGLVGRLDRDVQGVDDGLMTEVVELLFVKHAHTLVYSFHICIALAAKCWFKTGLFCFQI